MIKYERLDILLRQRGNMKGKKAENYEITVLYIYIFMLKSYQVNNHYIPFTESRIVICTHAQQALTENRIFYHLKLK